MTGIEVCVSACRARSSVRHRSIPARHSRPTRSRSVYGADEQRRRPRAHRCAARARRSNANSVPTGWSNATPTAASWCRSRRATVAAFRSWVLGLLDHAVVESPPELRRHVIDWLIAVVDGGTDGGGADERAAERRGPAATAARDAAVADGDRARSPLADVARRFDMTEAQVQSDLELVAMCGLPPFVDEMVDVFVDDGIVFVGVPRLFTRPLRLTAPGGVLAARLGAGGDGAARSRPGRGAGPWSGQARRRARRRRDSTPRRQLRRHRWRRRRPRPPGAHRRAGRSGCVGCRAGDQLLLTGPSGDVTNRSIVPRHVFTDAGNWYVVADDDRSQSRRTFRIDRIESVEATGRTVEVEATSPPERFFDDVDVRAGHDPPRARRSMGRWTSTPIDEVVELAGRMGRGTTPGGE